MSLKLTFLGAAGTVTGSKYLLEGATRSGISKKILIDAGMFQGERAWREKNWEDLPEQLLREIDAVLITHAHLDHTGILPRLVHKGLECPVYCTKATHELSEILLIDSAALQEEEAAYRMESGRSRHTPPLPLYRKEDAIAALKLFKEVPRGKSVKITEGIEATWSAMGHILGACSIRVRWGDTEIAFSGDIGRYTVPILKDPEPLPLSNLLLIESTYGDRLHGAESPASKFSQIINKTYRRGGVVVIPAFAVGRTQDLLFSLRELKKKNLIPDIPVVIDSPMASDSTAVYERNTSDYDEEALQILKQGKRPFSFPRLRFVRDRSESIKLNAAKEPMIIISASGMLSGGRILHHLRHRIDDPRNTILFVGFQPVGGRGDWIKSGAPTLRLFGQEVPIRAQVEEISGLSAHADKSELLRWCHACKGKPNKVAVVHGEPVVAESFRRTLEAELEWSSFVASYRQELTI